MADRQAIVDKTKAMLSKTRENGCTEHEEFAALAKARAWIDAYEISDDELQLNRQEKATLYAEGEEDARDTHKIKWQLCYGVGVFCNVQIFRTGAKGGLSFVGLQSDIDFAKWLLDHLADFVHDALFEHMLDCLAPEGKQRKEVIKGFVIGCCERIEARLVELCEQSKALRTSNSKALVVVKDQAIKDYMKDHGIRLRTSCSGGGTFNDGSRIAGQSAGERASFGRPVSGAGSVQRIGRG
jgi:hypothetical protein